MSARTLRTIITPGDGDSSSASRGGDEGVVYEVVNELGDKVGELAGSQLAFLVRRAVELD